MPKLTEQQKKEALKRGATEEDIKKYEGRQVGLLEWFLKDITGIQREEQKGFVRPIIQETLGSKGVAGVFQLPGRIPETYIAAKTSTKMSKAQQELYNSATKLLTQRKGFSPDSQEYKNLTQWAQETIDRAKRIGTPVGDLLNKMTSPSQGIATTIRGATTIGSFAMGAPKTALQAAGQAFATGLPLGAASGIEEGKKLVEVAQQAFITGLISAPIGAATFGITKWAGEKLKDAPKKIMDSIIGMTDKLERAGKDPSKSLLQQHIWGTLGQMSRKVVEGIDDLGVTIKAAIARKSGDFDTSKAVKDAVDLLEKEFKGTYSRKQLEDMIMKVPATKLWEGGKMSYIAGNELKETLYKLARRSAWLAEEPVAASREAIMAVARSLANTIKDATGTTTLFETQAGLIEADRLIQKKLANKGLMQMMSKLGDTALTILGFGTKIGGPIPEAILGVKAVGTSAITKSGTAVTLDMVNKAIEKIPPKIAEQLSKIPRTTLVQLINQILQIEK